jgi:hypothetical protein
MEEVNASIIGLEEELSRCRFPSDSVHSLIFVGWHSGRCVQVLFGGRFCVIFLEV